VLTPYRLNLSAGQLSECVTMPLLFLQVKALRAGADVVVATPGRLEDLVQEGSCRLSGVTYLVLDEADRMLDLGFESHIR